ncbi:hypothetical protein [Thermococcus sp.]|uniref:hypothetical protein n=2 Tax=Thermococcus sp. TaxID=35749 RepID=UPI002618B7DB|nr:hypothetical protein [Thermococcus sp.]
MQKKKLSLSLLGVVIVFGFLSSFVGAAKVTPIPRPQGVHYRQLGPCTWYGEDYESNSLSLLGGGWAYASADFHTCTPYYWYNGQNRGGVFGDAELIAVLPRNGLYSVETDTYFDVEGAAMRVIASVGMPPRSA